MVIYLIQNRDFRGYNKVCVSIKLRTSVTVKQAFPKPVRKMGSYFLKGKDIKKLEIQRKV